MTLPGLKQCPSCGNFFGASVCPRCRTSKDQQDDVSLARVFEDAENVSSEKELQGDVYSWLSQNGAAAIIWHAMDKPTTCFSGVSDFVFLYRGKFVAAEAKIGANKATKSQQEYIDAVNANGGRGFVFRSLEELKTRLSEL